MKGKRKNVENRRRGGKTILRSKQGWTSTSAAEDRSDGKELLQSHL